MRGCFGLSIVELQVRWAEKKFHANGLREKFIDIDEETRMHCWIPSNSNASIPKAPLLLIHGFGGNGMLAWENEVASLASHFRLYIPDLLGFGSSETQSKELISEDFQAKCITRMMASLGIHSVAAVVGHSYGGFVAYKLAHMYPAFAPRLAIASSGVCLRPDSNDHLLREFGAQHISEVLMPTTLANFKKGAALAFCKFPSWIPDCYFIDMMETQALQGDRDKKLQVLNSIILGTTNAPPLPKVNQEVLIVWGDCDRIFNIGLAHDLKEHIGSKAKLVIIKNCGHIPPLEKPKEFNHILLQFLLK